MSDLLELTAEVVSAYVAKNPTPASSLPDRITSVNASLQALGAPAVEPAPVPAVNPKRSVYPDYMVCLDDGKRFKSLKRHLMTQYGMTPDDYRAKWDLPRDYPMVAPNYAAARSAQAKKLGLGRKLKAKPRKKARSK